MNSRKDGLKGVWTSFLKYFSVLTALASALVYQARADVIFDNSMHDLNRRFDPRGLEIGDEIQVSGAARNIQTFSFEYWGDSAAPGFFAGDVQARVRFYRNDGALFSGYPGPGTLFYDSGWFDVGPTLRSTLIFLSGSDFPAEGLFLPETDFTWTVQFQGMGAGDAAGVDLYNPVATGSSYNDYWEKDVGVWQLKTNSVVMNFAAKLDATSGSAPPPPALQMEHNLGQITLSWPWTATDFVLESSPSLETDAVWTRITQGISV